MFRTPLPNENLSRLERLTPAELVGIFSLCLKSGPRAMDYPLLGSAWGTYFSRLFLTAEELISCMQGREPALNQEHEQVLREFIRQDCRKGGPFALHVIRKGGTIDRAALIMIAEPRDLAAVDVGGDTALHLLAGACDRGMRPAFIRRTGGELLSSVYDSRGLPVLYTIFGLGDLCMADLVAIEAVLPRGNLKNVMCRNRTGRDALTIFLEILQALQSHAPLDRHPFFSTPCRKPDEGPPKKG